jgi:hypothetical protein
MLTEEGKLTDIGSWYLGGAATNNVPHKGKAHQNSASMFKIGPLSLIVGVAVISAATGVLLI